MTYSSLLCALYQASYDRIEKDDRLLDVFPKETREKGVELWLKLNAGKILRIPCPMNPKKLALYSMPKDGIESLLLKNQVADLDSFPLLARGEAVLMQL